MTLWADKWPSSKMRVTSHNDEEASKDDSDTERSQLKLLFLSWNCSDMLSRFEDSPKSCCLADVNWNAGLQIKIVFS